MEDYLRIGVISTTHGIRGEVKVFPTTDDVKRFKKCKEVFIQTKKEMIPVTVTQCKFFKNLVILKFKEFDTINDVEKFRKCDLLVTRKNAVPLQKGEYFICDIIDATVKLEDGTEFGTLTEVLQTGANDVYVVVRPDGSEVLFPVIKDCVKKIDTENKEVIVHVMDGLLDD